MALGRKTGALSFFYKGVAAMGKRKTPAPEKGFVKKRKQDLDDGSTGGMKGMTPKQRQMMAASPEDVDTVRAWKSKAESVPSGRLPVLGSKGKWKSTPKPITKDLDDEEEAPVLPEGEHSRKKPALATKSFEELKLEMANIALILSETPEQNMKKLGELRMFCDPAKQSGRSDGMESKLVQIALLTTLTAVKDLMPGYAIRALTEEEQKASISKDVQAVRSFEHSFLAHYKGYLMKLNRLVTCEDEAIKFVANACLCDLLQSCSHFNHYEDVVKWVSRGALGKDQRIGEECCKAIRETFRDDEHGKCTAMIIRCTSDIIKDRDYQIPARILSAFLSARIRSDISAQLPNTKIIKAPKTKKNMSKRDQKELKKKLVEMQKFSDAEALVSKEEQVAWNDESLRYLFRVYFGVLKRRPESNVMPEILQGLAQFAHLICKDEFFGDLLRSLRSVTQLEKHIDLRSSLQCVLTVARIQALQEKALAIDIKFIYNHLFAQLGRLMTEKKVWTDAEERKTLVALLKEVIKALLGNRLALPNNRLAAFAQRLADLALAVSKFDDELATVDVLGILQHYLEEHKNVRLALLDRECYGQGAYMPECSDPDLCNPYSRTICVPLDKMAIGATPRIKSILGRILALGHAL